MVTNGSVVRGLQPLRSKNGRTRQWRLKRKPFIRVKFERFLSHFALTETGDFGSKHRYFILSLFWLSTSFVQNCRYSTQFLILLRLRGRMSPNHLVVVGFLNARGKLLPTQSKLAGVFRVLRFRLTGNVHRVG